MLRVAGAWGTQGTRPSAGRAVLAVLYTVGWAEPAGGLCTWAASLLRLSLGLGTRHSPSLCSVQLQTALSPTAGTCQLYGPGVLGLAWAGAREGHPGGC